MAMYLNAIPHDNKHGHYSSAVFVNVSRHNYHCCSWYVTGCLFEIGLFACMGEAHCDVIRNFDEILADYTDL